MTTPMNPPVQQAVDEITAAFTGHAVVAVADGEGGAFVQVQDLPFGDMYELGHGWVTFRIMYNHPHADIYPHYLPPGLKRLDGRELGDGFTAKEMSLGPFTGAATMVSRRSNHWNPAADTAVLKLAKVLDWVRTHP